MIRGEPVSPIPVLSQKGLLTDEVEGNTDALPGQCHKCCCPWGKNISELHEEIKYLAAVGSQCLAAVQKQWLPFIPYESVIFYAFVSKKVEKHHWASLPSLCSMLIILSINFYVKS